MKNRNKGGAFRRGSNNSGKPTMMILIHLELVQPLNCDLSPTSMESGVPKFLLALSIIQVFLYCWDQDNRLMLALIYDPKRIWEAWRFLTVARTHENPFHLLSNVLGTLFCGVNLERKYGWEAIATIYVWGTLAANLGDWNEASGGSAGSCAIIAAFIFEFFLDYQKEWRKKQFILLFLAGNALILEGMFSVMSLLDFPSVRVLLGSYWKSAVQVNRDAYGDSYADFLDANMQTLLASISTVSHRSHILGSVTGFILAYFLFKKMRNGMGRYQKCGQLLYNVTTLLLICIAFCVLFLVFTKASCCVPIEKEVDCELRK